MRSVVICGTACLLSLVAGCGVLQGRRGLVQKALTARDPEVRRQALVSLRGKVEPSMAPQLATVLERDIDAGVRLLAARRLGETESDEAVEALRASAERDTQAVVRRAALRSLALVLGAEAEQDVRRAIAEDPSEEVRAAAASLAAMTLPPERARSLLATAREDSSELVRLKAEEALHRIETLPAPAG